MGEDANKSKEEAIVELETLRQRLAGLEATAAELQGAKEALKESEKRFRSVVESSPMGIHMYELKPGNRLEFTGANKAADVILGVDNRQFIGKSIEEAFPPLAQTEVPGRYRQAAASGASWQTEQIAYRDNMISGAFEVHAFQTGPNNMAAMFLDITDRKRSEEELKRLRNLLSNVIDSMPSALVGVETDGRVIQWNYQAEKITGIPAREAIGQWLKEVFPGLAGEMERVKQAIADRESKKNEKVPWKTDGETRYSDITVYPLITNGVEGAVIRVDDVTERVRIEEMMIQSEKMLSIGGLAAGMAHEINNPLAGVMQNAQVIRNRMSKNLEKNALVAEACGTTMEAVDAYLMRRGILEMMNSIIEASKRAAKIVDNMLSFSRKSDSRFSPRNLAELLDKTIELISNDYDLKKKYDFRQVEIERRYDPDMPEVTCEGNQVQQVFLNILKNGAQAMAGNREKNMVSRFILRMMPEGDYARIEIEDNGPGMDETARRRIFEPFFTTKEVGVGIGLGLSVSYFIITQNHKGTLTVESVPGRGSKFIIRLPIKKG